MNWHTNWALGIENFECEKEIKYIFRGAFDFIQSMITRVNVI